MFKRLINHIKRWNKWRKRYTFPLCYKISVLFGKRSLSFALTLTKEEINEWEQDLARRFKDIQVMILREE